MRLTVRQRLDILRRAFPHIASNYARYLYKSASDLDRSGSMVAVWILMESTDHRTAVHKSNFRAPKGRALTVSQWAVELTDRAPSVYRDFIIPSLNSQSDTIWAVKLIIGWHFIKPPTKREKTQAKAQEKVSHAKLARKGARK